MEKKFHNFIQNSDKSVLVDFWAEWCGPCKMMAPILSDFAKKHKDKVTVIKVNVDAKPHLASEYSIQGIPTLILFKNSQIAWRESGTRSLPQLESALLPLI